jgi:hypothetical protein
VTKSPNRWLWALVAASAVVGVGVVAVPVLLIRPFSPQTAATVATAFHLRAISPWLAPLAAALAALGAGLLLRRRPRWPWALLAVLPAALTGGAAWLSHQNHFEWMFAPLPGADYERARDVRFVDDADMVVAVELNGDAVAFPVRQMAYHHVLNDEAGKIPIVSTY